MPLRSLFSRKSRKKNKASRRRSNLGSIPEENVKAYEGGDSVSTHSEHSVSSSATDSEEGHNQVDVKEEVQMPEEASPPPSPVDDMDDGFGDKKLALDDFILVKVLGKGSFGKVTLCQHKQTRKYYALKVLSKPNVLKHKQVEHTKTERKVLGDIVHPYVSRMYGAFQSQEKLYFVLEYCSGGELFFHLQRQRRFTQEQAVFWTAEILLALEHLHKQGVAYRDLKPENLLLDKDGHIRLCDFGLAKAGLDAPDEGAYSMCGTPEYLAPEMLKRDGHGTAVDWWGLGMVLYEMLTGLPPWYTTDTAKLFERVKHAPLMFPRSVSPEAKEIITGLLQKDPSERLGISAESIDFMKQHKLFEDIDWDALARKEVPSPYVPFCGEDIAQGNNFETQFTKMPINSVTSESELSGSFCAARDAAENLFCGFTYENESMLASGSPVFRTSAAA